MQILPATHTDVLKNIHKSCSTEYIINVIILNSGTIIFRDKLFMTVFLKPNQNRYDSRGI